MSSSFVEALRSTLHLLVTLDPQLLQIASLSLSVSAAATAIGTGLGLVLGAWIAVNQFSGRRAVLVVLNTLLALPSVVVGLLVYLLLSRAGPLGALGILFTPAAMVVAQTVLVLPIVTALSRQTIEDAMRDHGEQLRSMGAGRLGCALILLWDERMAMLTLALAAFGRAISEVGAVMIVGGNIEGVTRVMTTAIALETSKGDLPLALALGVVLLSIVLLLNALIALLREWRVRADEAYA